MAVAAVKPFKYRGERVAPGTVLNPQPDGTLARLLVDGRFCRYADQTQPDERPRGTGTGRRARAASAGAA